MNGRREKELEETIYEREGMLQGPKLSIIFSGFFKAERIRCDSELSYIFWPSCYNPCSYFYWNIFRLRGIEFWRGAKLY